MLCGNPRLIISLCAARDSWSIRTSNTNLIRRVDLLRALGRRLCALAAFAAAALLREERLEPGAVDEVACAAEDEAEEDVEEDAGRLVSLEPRGEREVRESNGHLRVEKRDRSLDDADGAIMRRKLLEASIWKLNNKREEEPQVLRVQLGRKLVLQTVVLACCDLDINRRGRQIAHIEALALKRPEGAADHANVDGFGLLVLHGDEGACRMAIDQLHAEDFGVWE
jgi:hypothetical protein